MSGAAFFGSGFFDAAGFAAGLPFAPDESARFVGSGVAWVYSEGNLVKGKWSKSKESSATIITGPDGEELPLVRGRIFMQVVPLGTKIGA